MGSTCFSGADWIKNHNHGYSAKDKFSHQSFKSMLHRVNQLASQISNKMAVVFDENVSDINLYTAQTPNGIKISITLEELGYEIFPSNRLPR